MTILSDCSSFLLRVQCRLSRTIEPRRTVYSRGLSFTLQCDNWITQYRRQNFNTKEPETLDWIDAWEGKNGIFFDIGANIGVYTIYAALRHPSIRVVAFEPEYANLHLLRDNIVRNGLQGRVDVYAIALSNRSGLSHLYIQDFTPGTALHNESRETLTITREHRRVLWREGIYASTLDQFCEEKGVEPRYIKIDVDGTEHIVLEGGRQTLGSENVWSLIVELPVEEADRYGCEQILSCSRLRRAWRDPLAISRNEVWVRDTE